MARIKMTKTTRIALLFLRIYMIVLLGLVLVKFIKTFFINHSSQPFHFISTESDTFRNLHTT